VLTAPGVLRPLSGVEKKIMSNRCDYVGTFISKLSEISRSEHRYKIFRDFVDLTALAFTNLDNKPEPNDEYLKIISHYGNDFSDSEKRFC